MGPPRQIRAIARRTYGPIQWGDFMRPIFNAEMTATSLRKELLKGNGLKEVALCSVFVCSVFPSVRPPACLPARPPVCSSARPIFTIFKIIKSSSDAFDGLPGADRWGVIEAKLNISFQNHELQTKNVFETPKPP